MNDTPDPISPKAWVENERTYDVVPLPTPPPDGDTTLQDDFRFSGFPFPKQFITRFLKPFLAYLATENLDQVFPTEYTQPPDKRLHRTALRVEKIVSKATTTFCINPRLKANNKRTWQMVIRLCVESDVAGIRARDVCDFVQILVTARVEFLANPRCRAQEDPKAHRYRRLGEVTNRWIRVSERAKCREAQRSARGPTLESACQGGRPVGCPNTMNLPIRSAP